MDNTNEPNKIRIPVSTDNLKVVDGKVIIVYECPRCKESKDINDFGVRKMAKDTIRRQSHCRVCRSSSAKKGNQS